MRSQGFGCSPIKKLRELGSDRSGSKVIWVLNMFESEAKDINTATSIRDNRVCKSTYIGEVPCDINLSHVRIIPREVMYEIIVKTKRVCKE